MGNFTQVLKCNSVSGLLLVPYLWSPISLDLDCGNSQTYSIFVASTPEALMKRYQDKERAWCSLSSLLGAKCQLQLSPFTTSYIGIRKYMSAGSRCRFSDDAEVSGWMLSSCLAGTLVFALAGPLSESMALRVTSGGLLFALGSVIILIYVMARQMPGRRSMATAAMMLGSSSWALLRWLTGYWLPSAYALLHNRWLLAYLVISGLFGAAITYLYGGVENTKLNTLIRVGLQLLGLLLLYSGTWTSPPFYGALVTVVVLHRSATAVTRALQRRVAAQASYTAARASSEAKAQTSEEQAPMTPTGQAFTPQSRLDLQYQQLPSGSHAANGGQLLPVSPLLQTPLPMQHGAGFGQAAPVPEGEQLSPLVLSGLIINPITGRSVPINGADYVGLVEQGYQPDLKAGRLRPPPVNPGEVGSPDRSEPGSGTGSVRRRHRSRIL
ncbi:hypothetical protein PLESTB_000466600 [Pleodorina starrii]|uniref:Nuclear envelope integral membrane protein 1 n=1 Tax=Pleodorina starrii TaxID=330485 RepID=A0A9W6BFA5_9CHLO|nr:hypothetical protein PLESTM_000801100 [Pleodorina starrii]GLC51107.1 hypothetical protein PLESTB_000466600 [Pleodorina starrii]GLC63465.1 hypothetical protein PLESTF_000039100 [Pleodorina starrii]